MTIDILTIFPEMFESVLNASVIGRARAQGIIEIEATDIRPFSASKHKNTDDYPYGGGAGMLMMAQPIADAIKAVCKKRGVPCIPRRTAEVDGAWRPIGPAETVLDHAASEPKSISSEERGNASAEPEHPAFLTPERASSEQQRVSFDTEDASLIQGDPSAEPERASSELQHVSFDTEDASLIQGDPSVKPKRASSVKRIYLSPRGKTLTQQMAQSLAQEEHLILLCGHYEGVDQRVLDQYIDLEISIGDYVLTGGELGAMVLADCIARLIPGVLGSEESPMDESFSEAGLLEYPQYTRPRVFEGMEVPEVLLNGNHAKISAWRKDQALLETAQRRPDLLEKE